MPNIYDVPTVNDYINRNVDRQQKQTALEMELIGMAAQAQARAQMARAAQQEALLKQQAAMQQQAAQRAYAQSLPEQQRALFGMAPQKYAENAITQSNPRFEQVFDPTLGREQKAWVRPDGSVQTVGGIKMDIPLDAEIAGAARKAGAIESAQFPYKLRTAAAGAPRMSMLIEKPFSESLAKNYSELMKGSYEQAQGAYKSGAEAQRALDVINSGKFVSGYGSNVAQNALRLGSALGINGKDQDEILANTRELGMRTARNLAAVRNTLWKDTQISAADQKLYEAMAGGVNPVDMAPPMMRRAFELAKEASDAQLAQHKGMIAKVRNMKIDPNNPVASMAEVYDLPEYERNFPSVGGSSPAAPAPQGLPPGFTRRSK